jgi:hypothetical protein
VHRGAAAVANSGWHGWRWGEQAIWIAVDPTANTPREDLVLVHLDEEGQSRLVATFEDPASATFVQEFLDGALAATGELNTALLAMVDR